MNMGSLWSQRAWLIITYSDVSPSSGASRVELSGPVSVSYQPAR